MADSEYQLTAQDVADILTDIILQARNAGVGVGIRNSADGEGVIVKFMGMSFEDGKITAKLPQND